LDKKIAQKKELEDKVEQLNNSIATLEKEKSDLEKSRDMILELNRRAEDEMKSYLSSRQELEKYGISMTYDIPTFASTVKSIAEYGYDPQRVLEEFKGIQYHQDKLRQLKMAVDEKRKDFEILDRQNSSLSKEYRLTFQKS
jgi:vacuolar-type H+-ATPase subunit I/STV1